MRGERHDNRNTTDQEQLRELVALVAATLSGDLSSEDKELVRHELEGRNVSPWCISHKLEADNGLRTNCDGYLQP
jgi:hypothetical protein